MLALQALVRGDGAQAMAHLEICLAYHEKHDYYWPRAWTFGVMAEAAIAQGDRARSLALYQASLQGFHATGDIYAIVDSLIAIASHAIAFGEAEAAARMLGVVERTRKAIGHRVTWSSVSEREAVEGVKQALSEERLTEVRLLSREMQIGDAIEIALAVSAAGTGRGAASQEAQGGDRFNLSPREMEIVRLLTQGMSNQEIGDALFISPRTAGTHVANILGKMGVHTRSAAVAVALNERLV
jgi:ATP/maltotriose-dependent transcriptional regulator MalT